MCCNNVIKCIDTIEVPTNSSIVYLPLNEKLERRKITAIGIRRAASGQKSFMGRPLAAATVIATAHIRIVDAGGNFMALIPLNLLERDQNNPDLLRVDWENISPTQSSVHIDTGAAGIDPNHVIELVFAYDCNITCK